MLNKRLDFICGICYNIGMDEHKQDPFEQGSGGNIDNYDDVPEPTDAKVKRGTDKTVWIVIAVMTVMCVIVGICSALLTAHFMRTGQKPPVINTQDGQQNISAVVSARTPSIAEVRCGSLTASGVVMKREGSNVIVMTNTHVIKSYIENNVAPSVRFYGEDNYYSATVIGYDAHYDIAVINVVHETLYTVFDIDGSEMFSMDTAFAAGDAVVSIGNAMSMGVASYSGIVSRRSELLECNELFSSDKKIVPVARTTAVINAGMSGGGVFDMQGRLIGLGTYRMASSTGVGEENGSASYDVEDTGFFTPVSIVYPVYKRIMSDYGGGAVGLMSIVATRSSTSAIGRLLLPFGFTAEYRNGVLTVSTLTQGTPAKNVEVGDEITAFGDFAVTDDVCETVGRLLCYNYGGSGKKLTVSLKRSGAPYTITLDNYKYAI